MGKRGRPALSEIRKNLVEILFFMGRGYGYDIYRIYCSIFPRVTLRSIYYHLSKGVLLEEFRIDKVEKVEGNYSWGGVAEKIYYSLGKSAHPLGDERVKKYFEDAKQGTG